MSSLAVPANYQQDVGVCKNMNAVIASRTFRHVLIKALKTNDVPRSKIKQIISLVQRPASGKKPTDEELTMLRLELLRSKKILKTAQGEFDALKFKGMNLAGRQKFEGLFVGHFGAGAVIKIRNEILQKIYLLMSQEALKQIPEYQVAEEAHSELDIGILFIARKYGMHINCITRMGVEVKKGRKKFIRWEAIHEDMLIGVGEDGKRLKPRPVD